MSSDAKKTIRAVISGRVQGVSYRAWTRKRALHHGVAGWVRNRPDRTVEALFSGPEAAIDALLAECRRGPLMARVDDIAVGATEPFTGEGFEILS
ncbi:acylphosphatase [Methylobacterium sp. Leaf456]|uniref:acylphosphatase n=1 Tax=Methylobacterium sp. Leaf456 TaxID=1736382 RepID=UPI0006FEA3BF|nr:acylphosphatase [Methylobacterium sp. Leaf456]KQT50481.1 acylphosphatase [Methylobacterium sp. Leaf456]